MTQIDKKKFKKVGKIMERINLLEGELVQSLTKKSSTTNEINVGEHQRKINELRIELSKLK